MSTLETATLWLHIAAGFLALLAGGVAMGTEKGGDRHRRAGRVYVRAMAVVVGTVPVLLAFDPTDFGRQFLLLVAVFSGYLVFSGYRVLSRKRPADTGETVDRIAGVLVVVASAAMAGWGFVLVEDGAQLGLVLAVFAGIGVFVGGSDLLALRVPGRRDPWIADHLLRMIGGYIATVTAVSVVNLTEVVPTVVAWLWPTAVGVPLIWYWQATYAEVGPLTGVVE